MKGSATWISMGYFYDIRCKKCGYEQSEFRGDGAFYAYLLPDGSSLSVPYVPAWCSHCQVVVHAEELPKVEALERQLREWQASSLEDEVQSWHVEWLEREIAWRSERRSSPKCLACGSDNIVRGSLGGGVLHPSCRRRMAFKLSGHFSLMLPLMQWLYSPEGEALGRQAELPSRRGKGKGEIQDM
jgi:hypothetical protein